MVDDAIAGSIEGDQVAQTVALGGRVLGVGVIVVKPGAVGDDEVALELLQRNSTVPVTLQVDGLVLVVEELVDLEASHVLARVLQVVIPEGDKIFTQVAADELHRLHHHVYLVHPVYLDAVLGLETEKPLAHSS